MKKRAIVLRLNKLAAALAASERKRGDEEGRLAIAVSRLLTRVNGLNDRVDALEAGQTIDIRGKAKLLDAALGRLGSANVDEMLQKLNWLHDRLDTVANNRDADASRLERLAYSVGQFDSRLSRLEQPKPPAMPRKRARKPATAENGVATPDEAT
jgi:hypothetical protein